MKFIAIDFETATPDFSSICQVGIAVFQEGQLTESWESLVNPEDYFDGMNVSIHGIDEDAVASSPKWPAIYDKIGSLLGDQIVVSHSSFDRAALLRASEKYQLPLVECRWLDTARVARRAWPEFAKTGYRLANVAKHLDISFRHHNACEDARAAGEILVRAMNVSGLSLDQWIDRIRKPIDPLTSLPITRDGNPNGPLYGETLVFTGSLSLPRREAADAASSAGCEVANSVTKHTTLLVVGDQDIRVLAGHEKSSKHRKAEELIAEGQRIRIVGESDFRHLVALQD